MLIPLATDRPSRRAPVVTQSLVAVNLAVFIATLLLPALGVVPLERIWQAGQVGGHRLVWYTLFTSAFLHAGFLHLMGNMITLWVFGPPVEDRFGRAWFLAFYLASGVVSGLAHALLEDAPAIGASGAIAGVTGAFLVLFPATRVRCLMFFIVIGVVMVPSAFLIGLRIAYDALSHTLGVRGDVATIAHLGGYAFGAALAFGLLWTGTLSREPYDLFTLLRAHQHRRTIRAAVDAQAARQTSRRVKPDPEADDLAARRAAVAALLAQNRLPEAARAYAELLDAFAHRPRAAALSRDAQLRLTAHLLESDRRLAARAIDAFLAAYPADPERDELSILLARVSAHDLGEPRRAIELLEPIAAASRSPRLRDLAAEELSIIRAGETP